MTAINSYSQPEVMGWGISFKMPDIGKIITAPVRAVGHTVAETWRGVKTGDLERIVTAPVKGATHGALQTTRGAGLDLNATTKTDMHNRSVENVKRQAARVHGSNFLAIVGPLKSAQASYASLPSTWKPKVQAVYTSAIQKARNAYIQNADTLMNLYRSFLTSNNPQEVTAAIQNYTLDKLDLQNARTYQGSTTITKEVMEKDSQMNSLLNELSAHGRDISQRQMAVVEEQTRQQGAIIDYETQQASGGTGGGLTKLIIPAALGVGAIMLLKG